MNILTDVHTHTTFSPDGKSDVYEMLAKAKALQLGYWGISEHFDYDYYADNIPFDGGPARFTDAETYFSVARKLQAEENEVHVLVGGEFGFSRNEKTADYYNALVKRYRPDFIVNSVHTQGTADYYDRTPFFGKDKRAAYKEYFALVRDSLEAKYPYDIVGHIGYAARYAPYPDKEPTYEEFKDEIDDILSAVIRKGKILEANSSAKGLKTPFLPSVDILQRYFELGGRKVSFASDAHDAGRLAAGRDAVIAALKKIGFTDLIVPCCGKEIKIKI